MKKNLFYLFALICSMSLFTACSDDDPDYTQAIDEEIAGDYKGMLEVSMTPEGGSAVTFTPTPQKISVSKASATAINLSISNFSFSGIQIGDINLSNCPLVQDGTAYTFNGTTQVSASVLTADVNAVGTVSNGTISLDLDITATVGEVKQAVTVTYEGTKLDGTEGTGADITAFTFDSEAVTEQPVIDGTNITFKVAEGADITALAPTITVSEGATVTPASGVAQDFSNGKTVTYTVVSEDYGTTKTYTASVAGMQNIMSFNFEEWETINSSSYAPYDSPLPLDILATPNPGATMLNYPLLGTSVGYPVVIEEEGYSGRAAKLITRDARGTIAESIAPITAGSVYTGTFEYDMMTALTNPLSMTHFGIVYDKKPVKFTGIYKYTPGSPYILKEGDNITITEDLDECAIQAVLYTISSEDETLDGSNIDSDDERIVARAKLEDGTAKAEWTSFELEFTWKDGVTYDETKTYKLAIVCSSSKDGAIFKGAANSTLIIDNLEIIGE